MKRSWLWICAGVVSLIATLSLAGQQTAYGQAQSNLANSFSSSVPRLMKFSGALKDLTGKPLAGPVEVNFAIYKEQGDAAPLWQETQTLRLDEQGRYTVLLGAMQAEGLPMELFASGEAHWLGIQASGAQAQPRVLLVSVPYALKAADAETLSGKPVSDFVLAQQLKEQVQTEVAQQAKKQPDRGQQALAMVLGQGATPMVTSQGQTSFTCPSGTSGDCVTVTQSSTGRALYALGNSSTEALRVTQTGTGYALLAMSAAAAVYGVSTATTGTGFAIRGDSVSTEGRGILGFATATTGATIGLWGNAASTSGTGLLGDATATTGTTYGLRGRSYSSSGTGILAYAMATTGTTRGLWAQVYSADGTAAVFQNTASGKLLSGVTGAGTGTEVFSVAANGNLVSTGSLAGTTGNFSGGVTAPSFTGDGAALTNLTAANISAGTASINISGNAATATTASGLTCTGCVGDTQLGVSYAASASKGGDAANALLLNGLSSSAFQPAGSYATLGANTFTATQTISSGDLSVSSGDVSLPQTTSASTGVINLGGSRFMHACCSATYYNTFVGSGAGNFTTTGYENTASGYQALASNTGGSWNTASGDYALTSNTTGDANTASGEYALYLNTTGTYNTASGYTALAVNTTGYSNTASGGYALGRNCNNVSSGCTANYNTALGYYAGVTATSGNANVTGANNTFLGAYSGPGTPSTQPINNATAIGYRALVSASNALVLGGTGGYAVNVGIGTTTPAQKLDVAGNINASGSVTASSFVGPLSGTATDLNCTGCVSASELDFAAATQAGLNAEATARAAADSSEANTRAAADTSLQTAINGRVSKAGDTMTGTLTIQPLKGLRANGLIRVGSETGTYSSPHFGTGDYNGLVIRRINTYGGYGQVIARTDVLTLESEGTNAGLIWEWPAHPGKQTMACTGIDYHRNTVNYYYALNDSTYAGSDSIYTDAARMVYVQCSFGDPYDMQHMTQVILSKYDDGTNTNSYWAGVVISTYNQ